MKFQSARLCDVGCGNGTHLKALCDAGVVYPVGVDISASSLSGLLAKDWQSSAILILADVTTWNVGPMFDGTLCSLPPINKADGFGLAALVTALRSITNPGGWILLKLFDSDLIEDIIGTYSVAYEDAQIEKVSTISHFQETSSIEIRQHFRDAPEDIHSEVVDTPTQSEVIRQMEVSRLSVTTVDCPDQLPGTRIYLLRRPLE
ncbi:class I SAM-dependent methyltransferase [Rhodobacteraceae bacterium]|nr:class I SAM-dependent methyltransferase [Paracoccaceae bacterium]